MAGEDVLTVDLVDQLYREYIGAGALRDPEGLVGALGAPFSTWEGQELYPLMVEKAARLVIHIQARQAFSDGNKRIAWLTMIVFIGLHGLYLADTTEEEAADFVLDIAEKRIDARTAASWISMRLTEIEPA